MFYLTMDSIDFIYTLFHDFISTFFSNIIGLPERRNKRKSVLEITKSTILNLNDKIIQQEMNKMAIHTHVIFRPRLATMISLLSYTVNLALVNRARFR